MNKLRPRFERLDLALLVALALPVYAILPLLTHAGLPNTADGPAHLMRQVELNQAWQHGVIFPRWAADLALGHGMPLFSYAPPALYQITQVIHTLGLPLDEAMKGALALDFLLYSLGMFLFVRRIFGAPAGLVAATAHVYAPYRLREAFIQGNYGQFTGLAFYPLILWAFHGLSTAAQPRRYLLPAALSLAGLLLSHNISAMLFVPICVAYLAFVWLTLRPLKNLSFVVRRSSFVILLALGLSAFFWLPAFGERGQIRLEGITQGFFDFRENFITLAELTAIPQPLDLAAINPRYPLALGVGQIGGAILAALLLVVGAGRKGSARRALVKHLGRSTHLHLIFFGIVLLGYAFLALPASHILWETVPLLELAEFPWRMLGPSLLAAAFLCGGAFYLLTQELFRFGGRLRFTILTISILALVALNGYYLVPDQFIQWGTPSPADAVAYEVASGAIGTTSTGEFLPRWADQFPVPHTLQPDYEAGRLPQKVDPAGLPAGATAEMLAHLPEADVLHVDTPRAFSATIRTLYWPGWQAFLDGQAVPLSVTSPTGLIQVLVPAGRHRLELRLTDTPLRSIAETISLLSLLTLGAIIVFATVTRSEATSSSLSQARPLVPSVQTWPLIAILLATAIALQFSADRFQMRSDLDRPLPAVRKTAVDFGDQIRLVGFDPGPQLVRPGDTLAMVAYWRALKPLDANYAVFLHMDDPTGRTLLTFDERHPDDIPTSRWPPGLYLRQPLSLQIPAGLAPIRYELNIGLYDPVKGQRLALASGQGDSLFLGWLWVAPQKPPSPSQVPGLEETIHFGPYVELLGTEVGSVASEQRQGRALTLYWRTAAPLGKSYTIFVHFLDADGRILAQSDSAPYNGLYPTNAWRPGQIIPDSRAIPLPVSNTNRLAAFAIGVYDPATGERLPATRANGGTLPDNAYLVLVADDGGPATKDQ